MCNPDCCCREASTSGLINYLLVFAFINLVLSIISIFIRAAQTDRYDQALLYLDAINKGELDLNLAIFGFDNCDRTGKLILDDNYYCKINGKRLKKPSEGISNQSLFKKWNTVELALSISRTIITIGFLIFLYFIIKKRADDLNDNEEIKKYENSLNHLIIFIIFLIVISGIWILIRALALTANDDIGLYEDGEQNAFEENIAINYILDIIEIVLYGISICFVIRIRRPFNSPPPPLNRIQTPVPSAPYNTINTFNQPPQNPIKPRQPQINGRQRLPPITGVEVEVIERRYVNREIVVRQAGPMNSVQQPLEGNNYYKNKY